MKKLSLMEVIEGIDDIRRSRKEWLGTFLKLENGIPDVCTFRNVIKE